MSERIEYKKTVEDEIDWKIIDQLHVATTNFSTASLELKKIFTVLIGIAVPALIKLAGDKLSIWLFIAIYILACTFWLLDSYTYFYQEKLRESMDKRLLKIKIRNLGEANIESDSFTLNNSRTSSGRVVRSLFNPSVWVYLIFLILNTISFLYYFIF